MCVVRVFNDYVTHLYVSVTREKSFETRQLFVAVTGTSVYSDIYLTPGRRSFFLRHAVYRCHRVCVCVCGWQTPNPGLLQRHAGDLTWSCDVSTSRDVWLTWPQQTTLSVNSPWRWYVHLPDTERRLRQDGLYALTAKFHYASWFRARSEPVRSWFGASSELASIMQFGFYSSCCCDEAKHHLFDLLYNKL